MTRIPMRTQELGRKRMRDAESLLHLFVCSEQF